MCVRVTLTVWAYPLLGREWSERPRVTGRRRYWGWGTTVHSDRYEQMKIKENFER